MKRLILLIVCAAIAAGVTGCNTVRGMGKDIERAGEGIQNSTSKNSPAKDSTTKSPTTKDSTTAK